MVGRIHPRHWECDGRGGIVLTSKLRLTLCCRNYDLTAPLVSGQVVPDGCEVVWMPFHVDSFWRMLSHQEFDVSETSTHTYLLARAQGAEVTALPIFPHRRFRHSYIYVNRAAGIERPQDLAGKRVGLPEYQVTAAVWVRGILRDDYGVDPLSIRWYEARQSVRFEFAPPVGLSIERLPAGDNDLGALLARGDLDAVIGPGLPEQFLRHAGVRRLFPDFKRVEREYFLRSGNFPIMHVVVVRSELLQRYPWLAGNLLQAFQRSKELCYARMRDARLWALVWNRAAYEEELEVFGGDAFPYGIEANRRPLETLIRYSLEQGMLKQAPPSIESLFPAHLADPRYYQAGAPGDS